MSGAGAQRDQPLLWLSLRSLLTAQKGPSLCPTLPWGAVTHGALLYQGGCETAGAALAWCHRLCQCESCPELAESPPQWRELSQVRSFLRLTSWCQRQYGSSSRAARGGCSRRLLQQVHSAIAVWQLPTVPGGSLTTTALRVPALLHPQGAAEGPLPLHNGHLCATIGMWTPWGSVTG